MSFRYLRTLLLKSAQIQQAIEREYAARRPDWIRLLQLKKLRLIIKDKLNRLGVAPVATVRLAPAPVLRRPKSRNA